MPRNKRVNIQAAGRGIVIQISGDGESAKRALEMVQEQLRHTAEEAKSSGSILEQAMERVKRVLEFEAIYEGLHRVVDGLKELVVGSLEMGEALEQANKKTGLSVETLSVLRFASKELGADFDALVTGIGRFDKNVAEAATGNKKLAADFQAMGLNAKELAGRTDGAEVAFHRFISTLAATSNQFDRNILATDMMGKAGIAQIPVLIEMADHWDELKQKAQDAGVLLTGETAEALANTNKKLKEMGEQITGAGLAFTEGLIPGVDQLMDVIREGKSDREVFKEWGHDIARIMAAAAAGVYGLASGYKALAGSINAINPHERTSKLGDEELAQAEELNKKAMAFRDIAMGIKPEQPQAPQSKVSFFNAPDLKLESDVKPFHAVTLPEKGKKPTSDNSISTAAADLLSEQGRLAASTQKAIDQQYLATLEESHKAGLLSDQQYYTEKLAIQNDELDAEIDALNKKGKDLQALYDKQRGDKLLKRDTDKNSPNFGKSAEELKTAREMLKVQEDINTLQSQRARNTSQNTAEQVTSAQAAELEGLKTAAALEKERGRSLEAQIALIQREHEIEADKVLNKGGSPEDAENIRATGAILANKLRIEDVNKSITETEEKYALAVQKVADAANKDPRLKASAEQAINKINQQEAAALQELVVQYDALAQELGGPFLEDAAKLHAKIDELNTPSKKGDAAFTKTIADAVTRMGDTLTEQTIRGKTSFKSMVQEIEKDAADLAIKLAEQKIMNIAAGSGGAQANGTGFWAQIFGASAEHHMSGGQIDGPAVVGEDGPEVWTPPQSGGSIIPAALSQKLADTGGGGGKGINVTSNVINQTSNPVQAQPSQVSYDSEMKQFVIHTILEDASQGGPTSQLMGGG